MITKRSTRWVQSLVYLTVFIWPVSTLFAEEIETLPEPLTLQAALKFVMKSDQFQLQLADERLNQALADAEQSHSVNDINVNLAGHLRKVGVSDVGDQDEDDDSKISLFVRKPLYDFGKTEGYDGLSELTIALRRLEKQYLIEQRELSITQKYFDVLNADNEYLRDNEDLAIGFIQFDRARENQELGLASEIEVMEKQAAYEVIRQNRYNSENMQRLSRTLLAEELGFPNTPSSEVAAPELENRKKITDDVDALIEQAFKHSLLSKIQNKKLEIARQKIQIAENTVTPTLDAELEVSEYQREGSTRDDWRASIYFDIPLYKGSQERSAVKSATAEYRQSLAELQQIKSEMRVNVLKLWQSIKQNKLRLDGEMINQEYRDMYLDRSRAEYELEFKSDLGDSMVQFSDSRKNVYQARYLLEMSWRRLEKLVGKAFLENLHKGGELNG